MVSIIILVYNAKMFTEHTIKTLSKTKTNEKCEIIVVDNASHMSTRKSLLKLQKKGLIDKLVLLKENLFFAKGNNIGSQICDPKSDYILLLNSDIEFRNTEWLDIMLKIHKRGVTSYGICETEPYTRCDGYCFLIDRDLYEKYKLDEKYEWFWSITKLQAMVLKEDCQVTAIKNHNDLLFHYGGGSGKAFKKSKGNKIEGEEVKKWFDNKGINIVDKIEYDQDKLICRKNNLTNLILLCKGNSLKKIIKQKVKSKLK